MKGSLPGARQVEEELAALGDEERLGLSARLKGALALHDVRDAEGGAESSRDAQALIHQQAEHGMPRELLGHLHDPQLFQQRASRGV